MMRFDNRLEFLFLAALFATALPAQESSPPSRGVARISLINGDVSVRRGDSGDWVAAAVNAPVIVQDRVSSGPSSRTEIQFDWAHMLRLGSNSEVRISELEYKRYQVQVARGTVTYRVLRNSDAEAEISTPSVSVRPAKKGIYRVQVSEDGQTEVTVRSGEVEVYTPRGVERVHSGRTMLVRGTVSDPEFQIVRASEEDDWDRWNERRDRDLNHSGVYRYVHSDIYGAEDLDPYGHWVNVSPYGWSWSPRVSYGWAPYRSGRWVWEDWYGWTWLSYDPWGWAPYHYGRWFNDPFNGWCWNPGGFGHAYWQPALVAFFGFGGWGGFQVGAGYGFGGIGWVPLAPYEPYYPWYGYNRYYGGYRHGGSVYNNVNVVQNVNLTNIYKNARVPNGITGVDSDQFAHGRIQRPVRLSPEQIHAAGLVKGPVPVTPAGEGLRLANREVSHVPPVQGPEKFFAHRQPTPVQRVPLEQQRHVTEQVVKQPMPAQKDSAVRAVQPSEHSAQGTGWRRFGEPVRQPEAMSAQHPDPGSKNPGWRQINERPSAVVRSEPVRDAARGGWRRFGEASPAEAGSAPAARPSSDSGRFETRHPAQTADPRVGERTPAFDRRPESPRFETRQEPRRYERSEPAAISPPAVHERSMPRMEPHVSEQHTERHSGGFGGAPPRVEAAPRTYSGGFGGPVYRGGSDSGSSRGSGRTGR